MSPDFGLLSRAALILAALQGTSCTRPVPAKETSAAPAKGAEAPSETKAEAAPKSAKDAPSAEEPTGPPWAESTFSPRPGSVGDDRLSHLVDACGAGDAALHGVAEAAAQRQAESGQPMELDEVSFELRRRGAPYVLPRMWAATVHPDDLGALTAHVEGWAKAARLLGVQRCGVGAHEKGNALVVAVVAVDVLAELGPLPTEVDTSTRVDVAAQLAHSPTAASIVLLPPTGSPFSIETELERGRLSARFTPTAPGPWLVQIMATHVGGPRPVAQAIVSVGEPPPAGYAQTEVPGEDEFDPKATPDDALFALLNAARREHGLHPVKRNRDLDRVAAEHCRAMKSRGQISHDTGAGDPARRVEEAGLRPQATGENVAMARSVPRLHRVLWASPSHRENLLLRRWDEAGVAIAQKADGSLLATEVFIDR